MAFMKVFKTNSVTVVNEYQEAFGFDTVRRQIIKRKINCLVKMYKNINSIVSPVATKYAVDELEILKRLMQAYVINSSYRAGSFCYNITNYFVYYYFYFFYCYNCIAALEANKVE